MNYILILVIICGILYISNGAEIVKFLNIMLKSDHRTSGTGPR